MTGLRNYKPRTLDAQLGFFRAAWVDIFAEIYGAFPFQLFQEHAERLRLSAARQRIYWWSHEQDAS